MFAFLFWMVVLGVPAWWFARIAARADDDPVGSALCAVPKAFTQPHLLPASVRSEANASSAASREASSDSDAGGVTSSREGGGGSRAAVAAASGASSGGDAPDGTGTTAVSDASVTSDASSDGGDADAPSVRRPLFDAPAERDDLKRISGIGPVMERHLNELGVVSFAQLAAFDEADVARVDAALTDFRGRIVRDDWVGQARVIVAEREGGGTT